MKTFTGGGAVDWKGIEARVGRSRRVEVDAARRAERTWLDTHDWRLFRAGTVLEIDRVGDSRILRWRALGGEVLLEQAVESAPRFRWDLRSGGPRRRLGRLLGVRALLPVARQRGRCREARVVDPREKTVVRLSEWRWSRARPAARTTLELCPVRGFASDAERVADAVGHVDHFVPVATDPMLAASEAAGARPGERGSARAPVLAPDTRADEACRRLLAWLVEAMEDNRPGTLADTDSEFLHDLRVAVRRTRALLAQAGDVLPARRVARLRREYAWLGRVTSPLRDLDVHLLELVAGEEGTAGEREKLAPLVDHLEARKRRLRPVLVAALESRRYRALVAATRRLAAEPPPRRPSAALATAPVEVVARRRIWRMFRRALAQGRAIDDGSPPASLHELRKTCKKLRYLLEFFGSAFPGDAVRASVARLKKLQDNLGAFQDLCVQAGALEGFRAEMRDAGTLTAPVDAAIARLEAAAVSRREQVRSEFLERFCGFAGKSSRKRFRRLFHPGGEEHDG